MERCGSLQSATMPAEHTHPTCGIVWRGIDGAEKRFLSPHKIALVNHPPSVSNPLLSIRWFKPCVPHVYMAEIVRPAQRGACERGFSGATSVRWGCLSSWFQEGERERVAANAGRAGGGERA